MSVISKPRFSHLNSIWKYSSIYDRAAAWAKTKKSSLWIIKFMIQSRSALVHLKVLQNKPTSETRKSIFIKPENVNT